MRFSFIVTRSNISRFEFYDINNNPTPHPEDVTQGHRDVCEANDEVDELLHVLSVRVTRSPASLKSGARYGKPERLVVT
jgi:hypothetical protein